MTQPTSRPRQILIAPWLAWLVISLVMLATAGPTAARAAHGRTGDFTHFWHAARAMLHGENIYAATQGRYIYPPLFAFFLQPLAFLPENIAAVVWVLLNVLLIVVSVLLVARVVRHAMLPELPQLSVSALTASALLLHADKIRALLSLGQTDGLMLLAFALVLVCMKKRPLLAGLAIGASANIKYVSAIFVPYFLWKRNFRAAISAMVSFVVFLFLPAVELGMQRTWEYARASLGGLAKLVGLSTTTQGPDIFEITWDRSVSLTSTFFRATHALHLPPSFAAVAVVLLFCVTVALVFRLSRTGERAVYVTDWMALLILALVFSPQTTQRHMVVLVLAYVVALTMIFSASARGQRRALIFALVLLIAGLTLPPSIRSTQAALGQWRIIGGTSWCALIFLFVVLRTQWPSALPKTKQPDSLEPGC
ncbi:MAG: DUF2029 domain-containing protein [Verrucomicrobiota bacterium]|nr:DUF2029 domain-containing protein [Verrucomicrobiota bacterium]